MNPATDASPAPAQTNVCVSYSHEDRTSAVAIVEALQRHAFTVWLDGLIEAATTSSERIAQTTAAAWQQLNEEVKTGDRVAWNALLSHLSFAQRSAQHTMILLRPVRGRGMLAAKVLNATRDQQTGLVAYLGDQTSAERQGFHGLLGSRDSDKWDCFRSGIAGYPKPPVVVPVRNVQVTNGRPAAPFSAPWQAQIFKAGVSASRLTPWRPAKSEVVARVGPGQICAAGRANQMPARVTAAVRSCGAARRSWCIWLG